MSIRRIDRDVSRFNDKLKQAIKSNFKNYISHTEKYKINGKTITIPVRRIEIPRFHYGTNNSGVGQGEGEWGDVFNHGDEDRDPVYDSEFTLDELVKMLAEELELPNIEPKNYGNTEHDKDRYTSITKEGPRSQRSFKRTMKEALKRTIASGEYDPENPIIIPEKPDFRHRYAPPIKTPDTKAAIIYLMDSSGSMGGETLKIAKNTLFWIDLWIQKNYKKTERKYIHYDTGAREVSKELFFQANASGGTNLTSGLELSDKIIVKDFNSSEWNIFLVHVTDGDYTSSAANEWELKEGINKVLKKVNAYFVEQINSEKPSALLYDHFLKRYFIDKHKEKIRLASIKREFEQIPEVIKTFFGKAKANK